MAEPRSAVRRRMRRGDYLEATRLGARRTTRFFIVFVFERGDAEPERLGITVTRKVGGAVRRNRIKRLAREWFRSRRGEFGSCDLVLIAKRDLPESLRLADFRADLDPVLPPRVAASPAP
jgi:ribonuclease P protein component